MWRAGLSREIRTFRSLFGQFFCDRDKARVWTKAIASAGRSKVKQAATLLVVALTVVVIGRGGPGYVQAVFTLL
jgi:hypothetical protein